MSRMAGLALLLTVGTAGAQARLEVLWDGIAALKGATIDNTMSSAVRDPGKSAGVMMRAIFLHPQNQRPATITYAADLPAIGADERLVLVAWPALSDGIPADDKEHPHDGIGVSASLDGRQLFRVTTNTPGWLPVCADLSAAAGRAVKLILATDDGAGKGNVSYDWALIGAPAILRFRGNALTADGRAPVPAGGLLAELADVTPAATVTLTPLKDGRPVAAVQKLRPAGPLFACEFDFSAGGADEVQVAVTGASAKHLRVCPHSALVAIKSLGASAGVVFAGHAYELRAAVENRGRAPVLPADDLRLSFSGPVAVTRPVPRLNPGETVTVSVPVPAAAAPGEVPCQVRATGRDVPPGTMTATVRVSRAPRGLTGAVAKQAGVRRVGDDIVLEGPALRALFLAGGNGAVCLYAPSAGGYRLAATVPALAAVSLNGQAVGLGAASATLDPPATVAFERPLPDGAGTVRSVWRLGDDGLLKVATTLQAARALGLTGLYGPAVLAGDNGTGARKLGALFPGLEYLRADEPSSSTRDFAPPLHLRLVPDAYKVTVPLMAVETETALVALLWDQNQKWHRDRFLVSACFASPNFHDEQANHRLQLFVPAGPDLVAENTFGAKAPYAVAAGETVTLTQQVLVRPRASVLDAVDTWLDQYGGMPKPQAWPRSFEAQVALSRHGFLHSVWDAKAKKSQHCHGWTNANAPQFAALLLADSLLTGSREAKDRADLIIATTLAEQGEKALSSGACCHIMRGNLPFVGGHLDGALTGLKDLAYQAIGSMADDGSWGYARPDEHASLGEQGAVELGTCAGQAANIWRWARISGDPEAVAAGRKALARMDTFEVPAGAQGWECPIHEPDILAAAYAIRAYVDAFEVTGEKHHLERAIYWARTGIAFNYLWDDPSKPGMRYASIPVFGSTFLTHSWLGLPVQWCGLVYGYALQQLARHDSSRPWLRLAEGLTVSGAYQQWEDQDPKLKGLYPDSWGVYFTRRNGAHINPEDIAINVLALKGADLEPRTATVTVGGEVFRVTAAGEVKDLVAEGDSVRFAVQWLPGGTSCVAVPFVARPRAVTIAGQPAVFGADLDAEGVNATYDEKQAVLFLRLPMGAKPPVAVRLDGLRRGAPAAPPRKARWEFDGDLEGWSADNQCKLSLADGHLVCTVTGFDPYFHGPANAPLAGKTKLVVRARSTGAQSLGLFWGTDGHPGTSPERSRTVPLPPDGQWHEVVFDLAGHPGWRGTLTLIRLDPEPAEVKVGSTVEIDRIELR